MGVPGFIPGVLDFSLWKTREALENKVAKENKLNLERTVKKQLKKTDAAFRYKDEWGKKTI